MPAVQKDPNSEKFPCLCYDCRGALVSLRTLQRHRSRDPHAIPNAPEPARARILSLAEWLTRNPVASRGGENVKESENGGPGSDSGSGGDSTSDESQSRPSKRRRLGDSGVPRHDVNRGVREPVLGNDRGSFNEHDLNEPERSPSNDPDPAQQQNEQDQDAAWRRLEDDTDEHEEVARAEELRVRAALLAGLDQQDEANHGGGDHDGGPGDIQESEIEHVKITQQFIRLISLASLDSEDSKLEQKTIERLRDPDRDPPDDLRDPDILLSLDLFISCKNASQETYKSTCQSVLRRFPTLKLLSYYSAQKKMTDITGVVSIVDDMCVDSCHAFTGPFADLDACSICSEPRFDPLRTRKQIPRKQACTIPLGPQIQALRRSVQGAAAMRYRQEKVDNVLGQYREAILIDDCVYDDIFCGSDYLELHEAQGITVDDTTVMFSLDGAQLYQNKKSDTWIAIWIVVCYDPKTRYKNKHVLPALIVPGPQKPKNLDSFMFRSFHHLSAIQRENNGLGIPVWNAEKRALVNSRTFLLLGCADAIGLTEIDGRVGHHGAQGCRIGCSMKGRHKPSSGHYYAGHLRPHGDANDHPDFDFRDPSALWNPQENYPRNLDILVHSTNQADYEQNRKRTGLSKPSILSGLDQSRMLAVPNCFSIDLMHLLFLNLGELLIPLWRGQLKCESTDDKATWDWVVLVGDAWQEHGKKVAEARQYFPSSFHRPPRNPAEKISSGFKATEYYLYLFGLGPAVFRTLLPKKYWQNFCKLVRAVRIIIQRKITGQQLKEAHSCFVQFVEEFENLYYQRRTDRLHHCRPALHTLIHTAPEAFRVGPGAGSTQFTLERIIGDLGGDIRQPSNPFGNLCQLALRRSQVNALVAIFPELDRDVTVIPDFDFDIGNGYILRHPKDRYPTLLQGAERDTVFNSVQASKVRRWGRLELPNSQVARSIYCEGKTAATNRRISRNVKILVEDKIWYAEVQFYISITNPEDENEIWNHALVSVYSSPDATILRESFQTIWACSYTGEDGFRMIKITDILSVVSMQPLEPGPDDAAQDLWYPVEKSGLDDMDCDSVIDED